MRQVVYDVDKFRELVVYIAERTADDPAFGDTKLNKALYFSDFLGYSHLGRPITGARYQKLEFGPAARALVPVRGELEREGAVSTEMRRVGRKHARVTVARRQANRDLFTEEELELVDAVVEQIKGHTATSASEMSHEQSAGWNLVALRDDIPYNTALIDRDPPTENIIARGREVADRLGW